MNKTEMIKRLRAFKAPDDGKGAFLGDGIHPGIRALQVADELEACITPEEAWDKFISHLNDAHKLRSGPEHVNLLGSIEKYKKIFLDANK